MAAVRPRVATRGGALMTVTITAAMARAVTRTHHGRDIGGIDASGGSDGTSHHDGFYPHHGHAVIDLDGDVGDAPSANGRVHSGLLLPCQWKPCERALPAWPLPFAPPLLSTAPSPAVHRSRLC